MSQANETAEVVNVVFAGHVDHGKSTIIGHLLACAGALPDGKLARLREHCARNARPFEYAFLIDALKDEMAQGITIDAARVHLTTARGPVMILDVPGHIEFLKNMVTGASRADAAFLVIDAAEGVRENSRRHATLLSMLGLSQLVVLVNKMDLVDYDQACFTAIQREYTDFLSSIGLNAQGFIPVSGREGDNLAAKSARLPWYEGPCVLDWLNRFTAPAAPVLRPTRLPVQDVYKFTNHGDTRRLVVGTLLSGRLHEGDELVFTPSGKTSTLKRLESFPESAKNDAQANEAVALTLTDELYLKRGELISLAGQPAPRTAKRLSARLFWMGKAPLVLGRDYLLKIHSARVAARVAEIRRVWDASSLKSEERAQEVGRHRVAELVLDLAQPIACDLASDNVDCARFVLVDAFEIAGGGLIDGILEAPQGAEAPTFYEPGFTVWFTGLSGAGKSTLAKALFEELLRLGRKVELLDGDELRQGLSVELGYSKKDRDTQVRRIGYLCELLTKHGVICLVAAISPYAEAREENRRRLGRFVEVFCDCPREVLIERDVKGLYRRALSGELAHFTGISDPYEAPSLPDFRLDSSAESVEQSLARLLELLKSRGFIR